MRFHRSSGWVASLPALLFPDVPRSGRLLPILFLPSLFLAAMLVSAVLSSSSLAQTQLINISSGGSIPQFLTRVGDKVFYAAADAGEGFGLYQYDTGSEVGGRIDSPPFVAPPVHLTQAGSLLFFVAEAIDGGEGKELWATNGSTAQEFPVAPGTDGSAITGMAALGSVVILAAQGDTVTGTELWVSDGTSAGTQLLKDIHPSGSSFIQELTTAGSYVFFRADDGTHGSELWRSDGTTSGTQMLVDLNPGASGSLPQSIVALGSEVIFGATEPGDGTELWKSDGVTMTQIGDLEPGPSSSFPAGLTEGDGWVYFRARLSSLGEELWRTNGLVADFVKDIHPGVADSDPRYFAAMGGEFFFTADDGVHGPELWKTDGTSGGTVLVEDLVPGPEGDVFLSWIEPHDGFVYFAADAGDGSGRELWRSDGTSPNTERVQDLDPGAGNGAVGPGLSMDAHLYLLAQDGTDTGAELYRTDSTLGNLELVWDPLPQRGSSPEGLGYWIDTRGDEHVLAFARTPFYGRELYAIQNLGGEPVSVFLGPDYDGVDGAPEDAEYVLDDGSLYFTVQSDFYGYEPAVATTETDIEIQDTIPGSISSFPTDLFAMGGDGYYFAIRAFTPAPVFGLFRMDSVDGPSLVHPFESVRPYGPVVVLDGVALFAAHDGAFGTELWRSDGVTTERVRDIYPGPSSSEPDRFVRMGDHVFFTAFHPSSGRELWRTDGTEAGTSIVEDIESGSTGSTPQQLTDGYPFLYFTAVESGGGREVYRATSLGTERLDEIVPGPGSGGPADLEAAGGRLYFSADGSNGSGREPWVATDLATTQLVDLHPGATGSDPADFHSHLGRCYFTADDGLLGRELWRADGTSVALATDAIAPGGASSDPGEFATHGSLLLFAATTEEFGREIWLWEDLGAAGVPDGSGDPVRLVDRLRLAVGSNPARTDIDLRLVTSVAGAPTFQLLDVGGRVVDSFTPGGVERGTHEWTWRLADDLTAPDGVYFVRVELEKKHAVSKIVLIR